MTQIKMGKTENKENVFTKAAYSTVIHKSKFGLFDNFKAICTIQKILRVNSCNCLIFFKALTSLTFNPVKINLSIRNQRMQEQIR